MERRHFDEAIRALLADLGRMGRLIESDLDLCLDAMTSRDESVLARIFLAEAELNDLQKQVDDRAFKLIALQQPTAADLRLIVGAIHVNADLERLGDLNVNIAESLRHLFRHAHMPEESAVIRMGNKARQMVADAITAFLAHDSRAAQDVRRRDDEVDDLRLETYRALVAHMSTETACIEPGIGLLLVSRQLERCADHATNIAESTIFLVDARDVRHTPERW